MMKQSMITREESLSREISTFLQEEFDSFQLSEDHGGSSSASAAAIKASQIQKQIQILALNHGITQLKLTNGCRDAGSVKDEGDNWSDLASLLVPFLLRYADAALTLESTTDNKDYVTRVLDLVSAMSCSVSISCKSLDVVEALVARAYEWSEVATDSFRCQACALLGSLAVQLGSLLRRVPKMIMSEEERKEFIEKVGTTLYRLEDILLTRMSDKSQSVRQNAIQSVGYLLPSSLLLPSRAAPNVDSFDSNLEDDNDEGTEEEASQQEATEALVWSMWHDPSVVNRVEALQAVPISKETVAHIVVRIRDVKEKVRLAALEVMQNKVDPRTDMSPEHFCEVIQSGLTDRCEATRSATTKLICIKWMKAAKFDPVQLLRLLDCTVNDEESEKALNVVLQTARSGDYTSIQELSDPEKRSFCTNIDKSMIHLKDATVVFDEYQLFYTRLACTTASESCSLTPVQKEDILAKAAPDIPSLCDLFLKHLDRMLEAIAEDEEEKELQEGFVCLQLLQLAKVAGLREEGSRRHFASIVAKALSNLETAESLVEDLVESLRVAHREDENEFFNTIDAIIDGLTSSPANNQKLVLSEEEVSETTARVLLILSFVLESASFALSSHGLNDRIVQSVLSSITNADKSIRELGISCFGKLGFFSNEKTVLSDFKPILLKIVSKKTEALQCRGQALLALADWSFLYADVLKPIMGENSQILSLVDCVHLVMQHQNDSMVSLASEVAAKMLVAGRIKDKRLMGRLLTTFLDPNRKKRVGAEEMESDEKSIGSPMRLQQLLSIFFPAFCVQSKENCEFFLGSIKDALEIAGSISKSNKRHLVFPLVKAVEYMCSVVEQTEQHSSYPQSDEDRTDVTLSCCLQMAQFLAEQEDRLSLTQRRSLCKHLGGQQINILAKDNASILKLKSCMDDLAFIADSSSAKSLRPLVEALEEVKGDVDDDSIVSPSERNTRQETDEALPVDDDTVTEPSSSDNHGVSSDDSTIEDGLMESLETLSLLPKGNPTNISKASTIGSRSRLQSRNNILESLGSLNNVV